MPGVGYALGCAKQRTFWYVTWIVAWLFPASLLKYCSVNGSANRKQARQVKRERESGRHVPSPELTIWEESFKQTLLSPDSAGNAERGRAETFSRPLPQHTYTKGLDPCLTDNHDKGFGQEVLGCICPMKWCHHRSSSDNSLGVTNLLA